jgi:FixJ family two-component response regulator
MPEMDGLELQRYLALTNHRIPIVFISANADEGERKRAMDAGATAFLRKPVSQQALIHAIQAALEQDCRDEPDRRNSRLNEPN